MWQDKLKQANVSIHLITTGAGAGFQNELWQTPGSSSYLSGCSFPYSPQEQEELLGFMPEHFACPEAAVDLASAAYMKAHQFNGKPAVGIGLTASVASEKIHRGDHRVDACIITNDKVLLHHKVLKKDFGFQARIKDGKICDDLAFFMLLDALNLTDGNSGNEYQNGTDLALSRFFARPFFTANGKRYQTLSDTNHWAIMSGAFNPPHEGHIGIAQAVEKQHGRRTVFEITANPPHKAKLSVQNLLQRSKLLRGFDHIFTQDLPMYVDKIAAFPKTSFVLGADAFLRMLDPKWGLKPQETLNVITPKFNGDGDNSGEAIIIADRLVDGKLMTKDDVLDWMYKQELDYNSWHFESIKGRWAISSTELRNK